jgi:enoyl-CoA hydratase/carnithine racemase
MACDLVFASERATFEWAYGKTGLTGAESSTFFLPRLLAPRWTLDYGLGKEFTPPVRAAWTKIYGLVAMAMKMGRLSVQPRTTTDAMVHRIVMDRAEDELS